MKPQKSLPASRRGSATIVAIIITVVVLGGLFIYRIAPPVKYWTKDPTNFEECANATHGRVMESYPRQCAFRGKTFVEEITPPVTGATNAPFSGATSLTADWKIYNNAKMGFEFKYPSNFTILKSTSGTSPLNQDSFNLSGPGLGGPILVNAAYPNPYTKLISSENIVINNISIKFDVYEQVISTNPSIPPARVTWITFMKSNNEFLLNLSYSPANDQTDLIKEILSTFRFTTPQ